MSPAGVTNHQRQEALGGLDEQRKAARGSSPDCLHSAGLPVTSTHTNTPAHTHADTHTPCHDTHAPCVPPSRRWPSWEDVQKGSRISSSLFSLVGGFRRAHVRGRKQADETGGGKFTEEWIRRWPRITIKMKRRRSCVSSSCR